MTDVFLPRVPTFTAPKIEFPPERAFKTVRDQILAFQKSLGGAEAVAARLASFGQAVTIQIHQMSLSGEFISFQGVTDNGDDATLVQHYTQVSVLIVKVKVAQPQEKRPIGFTIE